MRPGGVHCFFGDSRDQEGSCWLRGPAARAGLAVLMMKAKGGQKKKSRRETYVWGSDSKGQSQSSSANKGGNGGFDQKGRMPSDVCCVL